MILIAGLAVLWASRRERRGHRILIAVLAVLATLAVLCVAAVVTAFAWFNVSLGDGVGDHAYAPVTAAAVQPSYELGIGNLRVDLSRVPLTTPDARQAKVGIGELKVIVPANASVVVDAHAKAGDLYVLNQHDDGRNASIAPAGSGNTPLPRRTGWSRPRRRRPGGMTQIPVLPFERSDDDRVIAGVCGGVASSLMSTRHSSASSFALLALAGGAGILLYLALWAYTGSHAPAGSARRWS